MFACYVGWVVHLPQITENRSSVLFCLLVSELDEVP